MGKITRFWKRQNVLERKMFWYIVVLVTLIASVSAVFTILEDLNWMASIASICCVLLCLVVALVAVRTSLYEQCFLLLCCMLGCFLLPLLFLFCGGITSGMPLYCATVFSLLAFARPSAFKNLVVCTSFLVILGVYLASWMKPELVSVTMNRNQSYLDIFFSLVLSSVTLFCVGHIYIHVYNKEREIKEKLLAKLDDMSKKDPLTRVFNRRYLCEFLPELIWSNRNHAYVLMLDINELAFFNKNYGRAFGDQVLVEVASILNRQVKRSSQEKVARYGGGTFVCVLEADSEGEAFARAELLRDEIVAHRFEQYTLAQVSVNGGFVYCGDRGVTNFKMVLDKADELVEISRSMGRNTIRSLVRT